MAIKYGFFDATESGGNYDRTVDAKYFTKLIGGITGDCVLTGLEVSVSGQTITLSEGSGVVGGKFFYTDSAMTFAFSGSSRTVYAIADENSRTVSITTTASEIAPEGALVISRIYKDGSETIIRKQKNARLDISETIFEGRISTTEPETEWRGVNLNTYRYIEIYFEDNDGNADSIKVCAPLVNCTLGHFTKPGNLAYYKSANLRLESYPDAQFGWNTEVNLSGIIQYDFASGTTTATDARHEFIAVTKVVGIK